MIEIISNLLNQNIKEQLLLYIQLNVYDDCNQHDIDEICELLTNFVNLVNINTEAVIEIKKVLDKAQNIYQIAKQNEDNFTEYDMQRIYKKYIKILDLGSNIVNKTNIENDSDLINLYQELDRIIYPDDNKYKYEQNN